MKTKLSLMLDRPETPTIIGAVCYAFLTFVSVPFILLLLMTGSFENPEVLAGCQLFYYFCNFVVVIFTFRSYLAESFLNVHLNKQTLISTLAISVGLILGWVVLLTGIYFLTEDFFVGSMAYGAMPVSEMDILLLDSSVVYEHPLLSLLFYVLLVPFSVSCLYYAIGFAPVCCEKPWLAYLVITVVIAIPRFVNGATFWDPKEEMILYIAQLPIHLIACRAYQKCDTVWAPIFCLMIANLLTSLYYIVTFLLFPV